MPMCLCLLHVSLLPLHLRPSPQVYARRPLYARVALRLSGGWKI
jgi:hypothetical protein